MCGACGPVEVERRDLRGVIWAGFSFRFVECGIRKDLNRVYQLYLIWVFAVTLLSYLICKLLCFPFTYNILLVPRHCATGLPGGEQVWARVRTAVVAVELFAFVVSKAKILSESSLVPNLELGLLYVHLLI